MTHLIAVHLDLRDVQSARVWGWIRALGLQAEIEARPFSLDVAEPWDCDGPTFGLELLMLMADTLFGAAAPGPRAKPAARDNRAMIDAPIRDDRRAGWRRSSC